MRKTFRALVLTAALGLAPGLALAQATQPATPSKAAPPPAAAAPKAAAPAPKPAAPAQAPATKVELLDINSASLDQLKALKGVGDVRAAAIVKGRPYKGKDELVQKNIVPQNVYDDIKDKIIAKQK